MEVELNKDTKVVCAKHGQEYHASYVLGHNVIQIQGNCTECFRETRGEALEHADKLLSEYWLAHSTGRYNIKIHSDDTLHICLGDHDKHEPCKYLFYSKVEE